MRLHVEAATRVGDVDLQLALQVEPGTCLAVAGPSGAGKTTLLRIIAGLHRPERGRVQVGEELWLDTAAGVDRPPEERRCGLVFQDYGLFPHLRAWQNVAYALRDLPRVQREPRARAHLERLGLAARADARPATLSGGERQRVALARALARRPRVLLLDEPLAALDVRARAEASAQLAAVLREAEVPAILVTHDFTQAAVLGDAVAVVEHGRIVQRGSATELAARPANAFVADFTGAVVLRGVASREADGTTTVLLPSGARLRSTDEMTGPVSATVYPWEIAIEPASAPAPTSAQNRVEATIRAATTIGGRVRLALEGPDPLVAEVTTTAVADLDLTPGTRVVATWKASATRLVPGR